MRIFPAVAATGLTLIASGWVHAIGLGNITAQSAIGEPLKIEISLIGGGNADVSCLRLSPGNSPDLPWVRQARIALAGTGANRRVVVSTSQPVYEPIIMLGVELSCEGVLRREYPLLLPSSIVNTPSAAVRPHRERAEPTGQSAQPSSAPSLGELALQLYPDNRAQRRRFIAAARRAHPDQFGSRASVDRPIPDENALDIAALRRQAETPPRAALAPVTAAPRPTRAPSTKTYPAPPATPAIPEPPSPQAVEGTRGDHLTVAGDAPPPDLKLSFSLSDPGLVGRTSDDERERMRQEQRLLLALDEKLIAQLEIANKIRELEQYQRHLAGEADRLGISTPQPGSSASESATDGPTTTAPVATHPPKIAGDTANSISWWQFLFSVGGFALVAGLLALYLQRRRLARARAEADFFEMVEAEEQAAGRAAASGAEPAPEAAAPAQHHEVLGEPQSSMDFAQLDWEPPNSLAPADTVAPLPLGEEELAGEHDSAVELAEIMMSFGRVQGAAQTLADFIRGNPKQAVVPWLKLLEVYKSANMRSEFDGLTRQLNRTFNVKIVEWDDFDMEKASAETIERMPHIVAELERLWGTVECQAYLHTLLRDNRDGTRQGFPLAVIDDILCLLGILNQHLGPYRETVQSNATAG